MKITIITYLFEGDLDWMPEVYEGHWVLNQAIEFGNHVGEQDYEQMAIIEHKDGFEINYADEDDNETEFIDKDKAKLHQKSQVADLENYEDRFGIKKIWIGSLFSWDIAGRLSITITRAETKTL